MELAALLGAAPHLFLSLSFFSLSLYILVRHVFFSFYSCRLILLLVFIFLSFFSLVHPPLPPHSLSLSLSFLPEKQSIAMASNK